LFGAEDGAVTRKGSGRLARWIALSERDVPSGNRAGTARSTMRPKSESFWGLAFKGQEEGIAIRLRPDIYGFR
jgi:hypothetical protein